MPDLPTLLLLHGSMRTSRSWDAMARLLHDRFHVIALDARGHGDSDWTQKGYGYSNLIEDLKGFCDELNLKSMIAVGHSLGGEVLTLLAEQCPALFDCLVLLEPRSRNDPIVAEHGAAEKICMSFSSNTALPVAGETTLS